jgi:hypothetical protein
MKIKKWSLIAGALILAASLTYTSAFTQDAPGTKKEEAKPAEGATQKPNESAKPKRAGAPVMPRKSMRSMASSYRRIAWLSGLP